MTKNGWILLNTSLATHNVAVGICFNNSGSWMNYAAAAIGYFVAYSLWRME